MCSYYHDGQKTSSHIPKFRDLDISKIKTKGFNNVAALKLPTGKKGTVVYVNSEKQGNWVRITCPKCNIEVVFWDGGKQKTHKHLGCGGIVEN